MSLNALKDLLVPYASAETLTKLRVGGSGDGAYIYAKELLERSSIVYSYGIGDNVEFDLEMARLGKQVFQYDGTITNVPVSHENFHFKKENVHAANILTHLKDNGHIGSADMTLKMDIEGCEWDIFEKCDDMLFDRFSQMSIEFHDMVNFDLSRKLAVIKKISRKFFVFHIHGNNHSSTVAGVPATPEITFVRRAENITVIKDTADYPLRGIDSPSNCNYPELDLWFYAAAKKKS